jgi:AcrR family transcriptional regulator
MSNSNAHESAPKTRSYRLGKRAEKKELTRRRIVEAAVDLHTTVGPARTTVAQIAERAGVQRHTYYAHFPDDRSLVNACSALALEQDPLPDVDGWAAHPAGTERIRHGLEELYAWYARNQQLTSAVLRDAEVHDLTREIVQLRLAPTFERAATVLGEGMEEESRALLAVALNFACWSALSDFTDVGNAAALMARAVTTA